MDSFLQEPRVAVLMTYRPDGSVHAAPVWFEYGDGEFRFCTDPTSVKARNLAVRPQAAVCVASHEPPYRYAFAEGAASVELHPGPASEAHRLLRRLAERYLGAQEGARYADSLGGDPLTLVRLRPHRVKWYDEG